MTDVEIIIPTFNETSGIRKLLRRICFATDYPVRFIDDGTDDLPATAVDQGNRLGMQVTVNRRFNNAGGLSGAVTFGLRTSAADIVVVMDGDGQHPPETIGALVEPILANEADVVAGSRYLAGGSNAGLSGSVRALGSRGLTHLARLAVPGSRKLTDPLTGFFAVRTSSVDPERLKAGGFKILLEIVGTHDLRVAEVPFVFEERVAGESKLDSGTVVAFLKQVHRLSRT